MCWNLRSIARFEVSFGMLNEQSIQSRIRWNHNLITGACYAVATFVLGYVSGNWYGIGPVNAVLLIFATAVLTNCIIDLFADTNGPKIDEASEQKLRELIESSIDK